MFQYSFGQWVLFFYIYCVFGWCIESTYVSIKTKKITNRGFMRGPWLPIYGSGAIVMLFCASPVAGNILLTFLFGMVGASILEFFTGMAMEAVFKVRYWDYSNRRFNIMGHVCLGNSIAWGLLTILLTRIVHTPIESLVLSIPRSTLNTIVGIWTVIIAADFALSFKAAIDIRRVLVQLERAKDEMERIQKRLDVLIAVTSDGLKDRKDAFVDGVKDKAGAVKDGVTDEIADLRVKYEVLREKQFSLRGLSDYIQRSVIRGNPTMTSHKFASALDMIKNAVYYHKNDDEEEI